MTPVEHLLPLHPRYPSRLRALRPPPAQLSARGGSLEAALVVAIVGSREAHPEAEAYAGDLAGELVQAGAVVVSGGALGIDGAAHRGALARGGRTWVVAGTGCLHCFPPEHSHLFETVAQGPGAMIWPFGPDATRQFLARNKVLVALADAVVVLQAGARSGALHTALCARRAGKPLWVAPAPPWYKKERFEGSHELLRTNAQPLTSTDALLRSLGLGGGCATAASRRERQHIIPLPRALTSDENVVFSATSSDPLHTDEITERAHASAGTVSAVLLTLALENVVVEGPPGFFRRRDGF